jgi:hypothetical protein
MRENLADNPDISRDVQRIDPSCFGQDPLLAERINSQIVAGLEQIELYFRKLSKEK